jgi:hypothetical protein
MLAGTELNYAYGFENFSNDTSNDANLVPSSKKELEKPVPVQKKALQPPQQTQSIKQQQTNLQNMDPNYMTADQKLHLLTAEFQKQREMFENSKNHINYFDKLWAKRRDVGKLVIFSLVILFALSFHDVTTYYLKQYLEDAMMSPTKEFLLRLLYPLLVIITLWNIRAFTK